MKKLAFIILALFSVSICPANDLNKSPDKDENGNAFHLSFLTDSIILGTGLSLAATDFVLSDVLKLNRIGLPQTFEKNSVPCLDRIFMNPYSKKLDYIATGAEIALLLSPAILMATDNSQWLTIGTMYAETFLWAYGLKELGKFAVNRARPYMYFEGYPQESIEDYDWANSFPSGHTTLSFAGASFTGYVFSKYFPNSKWKWLVTGTSFAAASAVGIFRMMSGNHFLTDVLAGAAIGTLCGFAVPFLHTLYPQNKNVQISVTPASFNVLVKL